MFSRTALLVSLFLMLTLVGAGYFFSGAKFGTPQFDTSKRVFFSSKSCAECLTMENWLADKKISEKTPIEHREVNIPIVQAELQQAASYCKLNTNQGTELPLLFAEGKCYQRAPEIKDYFKQKLNFVD
jgi:hypothetical protein